MPGVLKEVPRKKPMWNHDRSWYIWIGAAVILATAWTPSRTGAQAPKPATVREIPPLQTINPLGAKYYHHLGFVTADLLLLRYDDPDKEKGAGGCLALWDRKQERVIWKQTVEFATTPSIVANDKLMVVPRQDKSGLVVTVHDVKTGKLDREIRWKEPVVLGGAGVYKAEPLAISSDSRKVAISLMAQKAGAAAGGAPKCRVEIWDLADGKRLRQLPDMALGSPSFAPDNETILVRLTLSREGMAASETGAVLWSTKTGKVVSRLTVAAPETIGSCAFSPDGKLVATAWQGGGLYPYCNNPKAYPTTEGQRAVVRIFQSPKIDLWDVKTGKKRAQFGHQGLHYPGALAFLSSQGNLILATADHYIDPSPAIHLWDVATRKELARLTKADPKMWWNNVVLSADGQLAATRMRGGAIVLWDLSSLHAAQNPG
jgi:WD40 repeat protein